MIVVILGFPCFYFALYVVVRQNRFALLLPLALSFLDDFTAYAAIRIRVFEPANVLQRDTLQLMMGAVLPRRVSFSGSEQ